MRTKKSGNASTKSTSILLNKKGQITVFIIIGIALLFAFAGIIYITQLTVKEDVSAEGEPVIASVPQTFTPIQSFTELCLQQIGKRGLQLLGQQGGYINPEVIGDFDTLNPTEADGLDLEPTKVPYWHYNTEPNANYKVLFSTKQPKLTQAEAPDDPFTIEAQLNSFVEEKLPGCLQNYDSLEQQGFSVTATAPDVTTTVTPDSVNLLLTMPLDAEKGNARQSFSRFFVKIPLNLQHYYQVAAKITDAQRDFSYLERQGVELLSIYSQKDPKYLAPTSDVGYELFSPLSWNEKTLKQKFTNLLTSYVPALRFLGSKNFYQPIYPEGDLLGQKVIDNMVITLTGAEDLEVNFDYYGWNPYFKTNSDNGVIRPSHMFVNYQILSFGTQQYETHYDISYPVLVTIHDPFAFGGEGYTFTVAMESNIRNNKPGEAEGFVEPHPRSISNLVCDEEQRNTELLKTVVVDSFTNEPLEKVKIGFTIPEEETCEMGMTDRRGEMTSNYPAVYGGVINLVYQDYLTGLYPIDTYKYQDQQAVLGYAVSDLPENVLEMHKKHTVTVKAKKKALKKALTPLECSYTESQTGKPSGILGLIPYKDISCKRGKKQFFFNDGQSLFEPEKVHSFNIENSISKYHDYYFIDQVQDLHSAEDVIITLERVANLNERLMNAEFQTAVHLTAAQESTLDIYPGVYKLTGTITKKGLVTIPSEERCFSYDILTYEKEECFTIDGQELNELVTGEVAFDLPEIYITITPEQLYTADTLTIYFLNYDLSEVPETTKADVNVCDGYACLPGAGCLFEDCDDDDVGIPARMLEDVTLPLQNMSRQPTVSAALYPSLTKENVE